MKILAILLALTVGCHFCIAQPQRVDSLKHELAVSKQDTSRVLLLDELSNTYSYTNSDSALLYGKHALALAQRINFPRGEARALISLGQVVRDQGDLPKSLALRISALEIAENGRFSIELAKALLQLGRTYIDLSNYAKAINYLQRARRIAKAIHNEGDEFSAIMNLSVAYKLNNQRDSSLSILRNAYNRINLHGSPINKAFFFSQWGILQFELGNHQASLDILKKNLLLYQSLTNQRGLSGSYLSLSNIFKELNQPDSSIYYAQKGLVTAQSIGFKRNVLATSKLLAELYEAKDIRKALYYYKIAMVTK
jgi:two-component system NtrC family sensor kinase